MTLMKREQKKVQPFGDQAFVQNAGPQQNHDAEP
jgi:hypothetical protein